MPRRDCRKEPQSCRSSCPVPLRGRLTGNRDPNVIQLTPTSQLPTTRSEPIHSHASHLENYWLGALEQPSVTIVLPTSG